MQLNVNLHKSKSVKNDEYYTRLDDVSRELIHYKKHFKDRVVFCNCNDTTRSAFWKYFHLNFCALGLKCLIATCYDSTKPAYKFVYEGGNDNNTEACMVYVLEGNGDFRNDECVEILKKSDIVVTNPPFSLFRQYVVQLMEYEKRFLIIGTLNAFKYSECFPFVMENRMWFGNHNVDFFIRPDGTIKKFGNVNWYTNLDYPQKYKKLVLCKKYVPDEYPKYESYDAIEVNKVADIPVDYSGIMGVPVSFMYKYNPEQFEIVGIFNHGSDNVFDLAKPVVNGRELYSRVAVRIRTPECKSNKRRDKAVTRELL